LCLLVSIFICYI